MVWISWLLDEIGFTVQASITIYFDNHGTIQVVDNHVSHSNRKQVELYVHYLRKSMHENIVSLLYCRIDIFMKPLPEAKFVKIWAMLGLQESSIMVGISSK